MEVILLERVEKLGQMGDVVRVKPGFARNFLLPRQKALRATDANKKRFEAERAQLEARNLERKAEAERVAKDLDGQNFVLIRQAGESGQLYGSVSTRDIADAATTAGYSVDRGQVALDSPIKELGLHSVRIELHPEVIVTVNANVARTEEEAERQARGEDVTARVDEDETEELDAMDVGEMFEQGVVPEDVAPDEAAAGEDSPGQPAETDDGTAGRR